MSFNIEGYKPESPTEGGFEAFKYNGVATLEKAVISTNETRDSEFYPRGCTMIELEATCMEDKPFKGQQTLGRKLWKRFNLDDDKQDKNGKTPVMKLADQLFPLGVEFNDLDELKKMIEGIVGKDIVVKCWPMDFKDGRDPFQGWNIKGISNGAAKPQGKLEF